MLHIPGHRYDVDQFYLEDLLEARLRTTLAKARLAAGTSTAGSVHSAVAAAASQAQVMPEGACLTVRAAYRDAQRLEYRQQQQMLGYTVRLVLNVVQNTLGGRRVRKWHMTTTFRMRVS